MTVKELKKGDYFKRMRGASVLVRGEYVRSLKKFSCYYFNNVNKEVFIKGDVEVVTDFEF